MKLTRRQLIARGLVASGTLVIGGIGVRYGSAFLASPAPGLKTLSEKEHHILLHVLAALFPKDSDMPAADPKFVVPRIDDYLAHSHEDMRLLFRSMLHAIEDHSLVFHFSRFTKLTLEEQMQEMRAWETTPLYLKRMGFSSVKLVTGLYYFEQPDVREALGFFLGCQPDHLANPDKHEVGV